MNNYSALNNPFDNDLIINDKTIDTRITSRLDEYNPKMKNKKKWCIDFWKSNEGYKRINDYLCRNKSGINNTYKNIPAYYKLFIDKIKENDEKLAEIIECIKSQLKPAKEPDNNSFWRGDSLLPDKNTHLETFCSVTTNRSVAEDFSNNVYKIILNNDVKRLCIIGDYEKETLIEDNCFYQIIDKHTIIVHSPSAKLEYPYRFSLYKNDTHDVKNIFKIKRIIEYYCDLFFSNAINNYIHSFIISHKTPSLSTYMFQYKFFIMSLQSKLTSNNIEFIDEINYDTFNELVKDIFIQQKSIYRQKFNDEYLPKIKRLLSKTPMHKRVTRKHTRT
jgi:hypothetical protein